jgi:hypothetical protein
VDKAKPFDIPKQEVWEAFKKVKANQGAAGVDGQSVAEFEAELAANLYKLWNRMSSGSYFPPPVRRVMIPKPGGTGESGRLVFQRSPIGSPRKSSSAICSPSWSRFSMRIPTDIDQAVRRSTPSGQRVSDAGVTTGCSISTSRATSTASIGVCSSRRFGHIRIALGSFSTSNAG